MKRSLALFCALALFGCAHQGEMTNAKRNVNTDTHTAAEQKVTSPDAALALLKEGHARFVAGQSRIHDYPKEVKITGEGQYPFATILSCIDSRTAPEVIFDLALGDAFAPRIAGNIVNEDILGSMEFASKVAGSKLIVVLGHTHCGAVKGACDGVELGNLTGLLNRIRPAVDATANVDGADRSSKNGAFVDAAAHNNVSLTIETIRQKSPVLKEMEQKGEIKIVGAMYDIETGNVDFF
jgi:carbonic anhydrase